MAERFSRCLKYLSSFHYLLCLLVQIKISPQSFHQNFLLDAQPPSVEFCKVLDAEEQEQRQDHQRSTETGTIWLQQNQILKSTDSFSITQFNNTWTNTWTQDQTTHVSPSRSLSAGLPEPPSIDGAGEDHVLLVRRKIEVGVVELLQTGAPIIDLVFT